MILEIVIAAIVGFVIGIFVYRNNVDTFSPFATKIDALYDKMETRIQELKMEIEKLKDEKGL